MKAQYIFSFSERFNKLVFIRETHPKDGKRRALFRCDCGNLTEVDVYGVRNGCPKSCGCAYKDYIDSGSHKTHGLTRTHIYARWKTMLSRCRNPNSQKYPRYGARGIKVCDRWKKFENFIEDMGHPPKGASIDRIDNNGDYEPSNCRWATPKEQSNNMSRNIVLEYDGKTMTAAEWEDHLGYNREIISARIRLGWSVERAITQKPRKSRKR